MFKWLEKFLKKVEKANKEEFGANIRKMDCCSVNKSNRNEQQKSKKRSV